jgi:Tol biopolymer transport system component
MFPFWSPDSRSIGFIAENKLKTLDILSGRLVTVCDAPFPRGASWGPDGTILFSPETRSEIWRVAAAGGTPVAVTRLAPGSHTTHRWPQFLPDGKHFLYFAANHDDPHGTDSAVYLASLDGALNRPLIHSLAGAEYASGYLLYVRAAALVAQPFDLDKLELREDATVLAEDVTRSVSTWGAVFSASQNGVLAYQSAGRTTETELRWCDRSGTKLATLGTGNYLSPRLSPDGSRLGVEFGVPNSEVWVFDLKRSIKTRLTFDRYDDVPVWSPDGAWIIFAGGKTYRDGDIFRIKSDGQGPREALYVSSELKVPTDWSSDGHFLLFDKDYTAHTQVYVLPLEGNRKPYPFLPSRFVQRSGHFSADGRWVAYVSRESGSDEVYVAPFHGPGGKWRISNAGGKAPRWRRDGRELFFVAPDNTLMSAQMETRQNKIEVKSVHPLFHANFAIEFAVRAGSYDVTPDGSRFLINVNNDEPDPPITLVLNWPALFKRK